MELIQRFGANYTDEYVDAYIEEMEKHPGACDTVWLPTPWSYPTMDVHRAYADCWKRAAKKLRAHGFKVSLQVSATIGRVSAVSLLNCTVGKSGEMELLVRRPVGGRVTFMSQYNGTCEPDREVRGDEMLVRVPPIDAWSVATLFFE